MSNSTPPIDSPEPFTVDVPQSALDDLADRLRRTRLPVDFVNDDWRYGVNREYLRELIEYWLDRYDWRATEAAINAFDNFRTTIRRGPDPFRSPARRGAQSHPADPWPTPPCMAVTPPTLSTSSCRRSPAMASPVRSRPPASSPRATGDLWLRLMRDVLGYERFAAQGGDWGAIITAQMGHKFADHLIGIHLSMPGLPGVVLNELSAADYGPGEEEWYDRMRTRMRTARSHLALNSNDPQTAAYALNDSLAGLAAWIVERRRNFGDTNGDVESRFSKDHLITTTMIYWITESFGTALRFYWENAHDPWKPQHDRRPVVEAPTGFRGLSAGAAADPARGRGARDQPPALDGDAQRWSLCPGRGAAALPGGCADLLPRSPLSPAAALGRRPRRLRRVRRQVVKRRLHFPHEQLQVADYALLRLLREVQDDGDVFGRQQLPLTEQLFPARQPLCPRRGSPAPPSARRTRPAARRRAASSRGAPVGSSTRAGGRSCAESRRRTCAAPGEFPRACRPI